MAAMAAPTGQGDIQASRFALTIDGQEIASFNELTELTSEVEPVELMESTDKELILKKLPGKAKPATVTLSRSMTSSMDLWAWHEAVLQGNIAAARKSATLVMYSPDGKAVARYHLEQAWPSKLEVAPPETGAKAALRETVTIVCEHIQRVAG
jgi:phage tail-like protein